MGTGLIDSIRKTEERNYSEFGGLWDMKERIPAFNFIRAACAIGIIFNHFTIDSQNAMEHIFDKYPNGGAV